MAIEIKVPTVGESINEVTLTKWLKKDGEWVERDEVVAELESEKATFEINAEQAGILHTLAKEEQDLKIGDVVATIDETAQKPAGKEEPKKEAAPVSEAKPEAQSADKKMDASKVNATGSQGRITKNDVLDALSNPGRAIGKELFSREEKSQKMSNLRRTISRRLVEAKNSTAMLTTFNEVDMSPIMELRAKYKEVFKKTHEVNLCRNGLPLMHRSMATILSSMTMLIFLSPCRHPKD